MRLERLSKIWTIVSALTLALVLILLLMSSASGQETIDPDVMCVTRAQYWEAVRLECAEAEAKAAEFSACRSELGRVAAENNRLRGQLESFAGVDAQRIALVARLAEVQAERDSRWSSFAFGGGIVGGIAAGFVTGFILSEFQ
jgi:hypothetical protein